MDRKTIEYNCVGCGNCAGVYPNDISMNLTNKGFIRPEFQDDFQLDKLNDICPIVYDETKSIGNLWGKYKNVLCAYSSNLQIRKCASSGGVISSLLIWLLETKQIDAVLEIGADHENPLKNTYYLCKSKDEILHCSGSRYAPAAPLEKILEIISKDIIIAFVGKPCDVRAIRKLMRINNMAQEHIKYVFSFFCAGTPSMNATISMAEKMGADSLSIKSVSYRGNGWPGYATVTDAKGSYTMSYEKSWGGILGRNKQQFCRICVDGAGEDADISCGDCWYLDDENNPVFSEEEGRNIVFLRTDTGREIFECAVKDGVLVSERYDIELLKYVQPYQFERKTTLIAQIIALKVMKKYVPNYNFKDLICLARKSHIKKLLCIFVGTIKRIRDGRIE